MCSLPCIAGEGWGGVLLILIPNKKTAARSPPFQHIKRSSVRPALSRPFLQPAVDRVMPLHAVMRLQHQWFSSGKVRNSLNNDRDTG